MPNIWIQLITLDTVSYLSTFEMGKYIMVISLMTFFFIKKINALITDTGVLLLTLYCTQWQYCFLRFGRMFPSKVNLKADSGIQISSSWLHTSLLIIFGSISIKYNGLNIIVKSTVQKLSGVQHQDIWSHFCFTSNGSAHYF